MIIEYKNTTVF